mmetsp:Transcript_10522/g.16663  ORF Transcript_10522/g.16663 Transcript_10522/m.16663 type:complete len:250 (-) Transcript_10522:108-857(-)
MNPISELIEGRRRLLKENDYMASRSKVRPYRHAIRPRTKVQPNDLTTEFYRVPQLGEPVQMIGMSTRPELNGACAEVVSNGADEEGFFVVRLQEAVADRTRKMKVRASYLAPLHRPASAPDLRMQLGPPTEHSSYLAPLHRPASAPDLHILRSSLRSSTGMRSVASESCNSCQSSKLGKSGRSTKKLMHKGSVRPNQTGNDRKRIVSSLAPDFGMKFHPVPQDERIDLPSPWAADVNEWKFVISRPPVR